MSNGAIDKGGGGGDPTSTFVEEEIARQHEQESDDGLEADRADAFIAKALAEVCVPTPPPKAYFLCLKCR